MLRISGVAALAGLLAPIAIATPAAAADIGVNVDVDVQVVAPHVPAYVVSGPVYYFDPGPATYRHLRDHQYWNHRNYVHHRIHTHHVMPVAPVPYVSYHVYGR